MRLVECLAKRSFAYLEGATKGRNVERLVQFGESQLLSAYNERSAGSVGPRNGHFRYIGDPAMDGH
jgi:hypothetical protein